MKTPPPDPYEKPTIEVITKEQYEGPKQINYLDRLLQKRDSVNPHPILGTVKA
jgi:hypothetical protein